MMTLVLLVTCFHICGDIKNAVVIDVGCSNGKAVLGSKQCLFKHGIDIYAIGIDISTRKNIITNAEKNLDEFVNKNVLEVNQYVGKSRCSCMS